MKRMLLLMPFFMGYEKILADQFSNGYDVTLVNSDEFDKEIIADYFQCSKLHWGARHVLKNLEIREQEEAASKTDAKVLEKISQEDNAYDIVFCINGGYLSKSVFTQIKAKNPDAQYILYLWDDVDNLFSSTHTELFDKVFAYNIQDCEKHSWTYQPMFVQSGFIGHKENEYDIAFIGSAHSDRMKIAKLLHDKYAEKYRLFIYLYDPNDSKQEFCHNVPLSYTEYLEVLSKSKAVIDLPADVQKGPTTRLFDSLQTETKVITTNKNLSMYPVFSNNVHIVDREKWEIDDDFMNRDYEKTEYKALTPDKWIKSFGL